MTPRLTDEQREAISRQPDCPIEVEDDQTKTVYVLMTRQQFQTLVYDDSDLTPEEMTAAAEQAIDDPDGWGAPSMAADDTEPVI